MVTFYRILSCEEECDKMDYYKDTPDYNAPIDIFKDRIHDFLGNALFGFIEENVPEEVA